MAVIPRSYVDALTEALNTLSEGVQLIAAKQLAAIEYTSIEDLREQVIAILEPLLSYSAEAAAAYAATAYDAIREYATGDALGATAHSGRVPAATAGAVEAFVDIIEKGKPWEIFVDKVLNRCDYEIKRAAGESTVYNAEHDSMRPHYARVPQGSETCSFCLMLASFGFHYTSEHAAGKDNREHYHPHCNCRIVAEFGDGYEGYDPDKMYEQTRKCQEAIESDARRKWDQMTAEERANYKGGWNHYLRNRTAAEMATRDKQWLIDGTIPEIQYSPVALKDFIENRIKPHEKETAEFLLSQGIKCVFRIDERSWTDIATRQVHRVGLADLDDGIELKALLNAKSIDAVDNAIHKAKHKEDMKVCVIDNRRKRFDDDDVEEEIIRSMKQRNVKDCVLITSSGEFRRYK